MQRPFNFRYRGLLLGMAVAFVVSAAITYAFEIGQMVLVLGFCLLMLGVSLPRARVRNLFSFSYPPPTQAEGSIAAVGVSLMVGVTIGAAAQQLLQG
jgi:hypothetical protein